MGICNYRFDRYRGCVGSVDSKFLSNELSSFISIDSFFVIHENILLDNIFKK